MTIAEGSAIKLSTGRSLKLGKELNRGGAGSVHHLVGAPTMVAKIYRSSADREAYASKLKAMLALPPKQQAQLAWPSALVNDKAGHFCGFAMPKLALKQTLDLESVLQVRQAEKAGVCTGLGERVTLAANLSVVVASLHESGHRVIDLKPPNIRFARGTLHVTMLDCDGFSIQGEGERFAALQFTPEYLAPELHGRMPSEHEEEQQDRFALAVIIFQLLNFGLHPFTGTPRDDRVPTGITERIAGGFYAYGIAPNKRMKPSLVSGHELLPFALRRSFDHAFASTSGLRPSASAWSELLLPYARRASGLMVVCSKDRSHQHFSSKGCAACGREKLLSQTTRSAQKTRPAAKQRNTKIPAILARPAIAQVLAPPAPSSAAPTHGCGLELFVCLTVVFVFALWMCNARGEPPAHEQPHRHAAAHLSEPAIPAELTKPREDTTPSTPATAGP